MKYIVVNTNSTSGKYKIVLSKPVVLFPSGIVHCNIHTHLEIKLRMYECHGNQPIFQSFVGVSYIYIFC